MLEKDGPVRRRYCVSTQHAAEVMGLTIAMAIRRLKRAGVGYLSGRRPANAIGPGGKLPSRAFWWDLDGVLAESERREAEQDRTGILPQVWRDRLRRPVVRTRLEAPKDDVLIAASEAASMLEISRSALGAYVASGRLFVWQEKPGRRGSRLWFSANQVRRYADDEMRLQRRARRLEGAAPREPWDLTNAQLWAEERGIEDLDRHGNGANARRDFGEFFTTHQACRELGVQRDRLRVLRESGRIRGYRADERDRDEDDPPMSYQDALQLGYPKKGAGGCGNRWWFYRKEDVYNLLAEPGYMRRRKAWRRSRDAKFEGKPEGEPAELDYRQRIRSRPDGWVAAEAWRAAME